MQSLTKKQAELVAKLRDGYRLFASLRRPEDIGHSPRTFLTNARLLDPSGRPYAGNGTSPVTVGYLWKRGILADINMPSDDRQFVLKS